MQIQKHLELLGMSCKDRVTGMTGVVTSISFDLYGCVQAVVHPGLDEKGALRDPPFGLTLHGLKLPVTYL